MIPKIHKKGVSFRGAAHYLLRDLGADTAERVAWVEVRNVASRNPEVAWRVMAATAIDQDRLKEEAGIPKTGRKSKQSVLHFSLSWHAEEAPSLSREEMLRAANTVLHVMQAQDHQALVICHTDKPQPHVHVLVNRVNPTDGRMLSSSFEKLNVSKWAQKYEEERGKIYCDQRVVNNAARERQEYTRGKKDQPRNVHELAKEASNENQRKQLLEEHRRREAALKEAERKLKARHKEAWSLLDRRNREAVAQLAERTRQQITRGANDIRARYRPLWELTHHERQAALRQFEQREAQALGRMKNALQAIDFKSLLGKKGVAEDGRAKTLSEAFSVLGNAGARWQTLKKQLALREQELQRRQRREEQETLAAERLRQQRQLEEHRKRFEAERQTLILQQAMERTKLKAQWLEKGRQTREQLRQLRAARDHEAVQKQEAARDRATQALQASQAQRVAQPQADPSQAVQPRAIQPRTPQPEPQRASPPPLAQEFAKAAAPEPARQQEETQATAPPPRPRTIPSDLLPQRNAQQAAQVIDSWEQMLEKRAEHGWEREQGDERER